MFLEGLGISKFLAVRGGGVEIENIENLGWKFVVE